jgi:hypothetical protein
MKSLYDGNRRFLPPTFWSFCLLIILTLGVVSPTFSNETNIVGNINNQQSTLTENIFSSFNLLAVNNLNSLCAAPLNIHAGSPFYDTDCKTDVAIWRPGTTGEFWTLGSNGNTQIINPFGSTTTEDKPLGGDYDGDGITDLAVFSKLSGNKNWWNIINSDGSGISHTYFGTAPYDFPTPADYDGDKKTDVSIFRLEAIPTSTSERRNRSVFYYFKSSSVQRNELVEISLSEQANTDINLVPVVNNYDGDDKADIATWNRDNGQWIIKYSSTGAVNTATFGTSGDIPVPGVYKNGTTNDALSDLAVWRPSTGTWWVFHTNSGAIQQVQFGLQGDEPVPGDYDGDGFLDFAVRRPSTGYFYILGSSAGFFTRFFGSVGDIPIALPKYPTSMTSVPSTIPVTCPTGSCKEYLCPKNCR